MIWVPRVGADQHLLVGVGFNRLDDLSDSSSLFCRVLETFSDIICSSTFARQRRVISGGSGFSSLLSFLFCLLLFF